MSKFVQIPELFEDEIQAIYEWIDEIPLSRPKRNITRDFADGAMLAEVIKHYHPRIVELHNYPLAHNTQQKVNNWNILNTKVFKKMGFQISRADIDKVINSVPNSIEKILAVVKEKIENFKDIKEEPVEDKIRDTSVGKKEKIVENKNKLGENKNKVEENKAKVPEPKNKVVENKNKISEVKVSGQSNVIKEKEAIIQELKETIDIMENKINKLEQLVKLKDSKIQILNNKIAAAGLS